MREMTLPTDLAALSAANKRHRRRTTATTVAVAVLVTLTGAARWGMAAPDAR